MKLTFNEKHLKIIFEILLAVGHNAYAGKDTELAKVLINFSKKFEGNRAYVSLKREEAKSLKDFVESVRDSLVKLQADAEKKESLEDKENILTTAAEQIAIANEIIGYVNQKLAIG